MDDAHVLLRALVFCAQNLFRGIISIMEVIDMSSYGKKSEPPRQAIKEMKSRHSEDSSKDPLHRSVRRGKARAKRNK